MQTFLFYDIESTGLNKSFEQVLQFAAIRTNLQLEEIERHEILVKLNPDAVPAPRAVLTHHIGVADTNKDLCEFEAIGKIHALMNTPGTISLGYNTLGFDDEFLRFSFFRNLLTPYTHQYANGCQRMDLYPMATMFRLYKPEVLVWPKIDGKPKMKLELINKCNNLASGPAHDAMVDVEVTVALARKLYQQKEMWDYLLGFFRKDLDLERQGKLPLAFNPDFGIFREGLIIDSSMGPANFYQSRMVCLGGHLHYKNQTIWLRLDHPNLRKTRMDNVDEHTWAYRKKSAEPGFVLPPKERFLQFYSEERLALVNKNKEWLIGKPKLWQEIVDYHLNYTYPDVPNVDMDAYLYANGFFNREESTWCQRFRQANVKDMAALSATTNNSVLRELAMRILGRNYPDAMTPELKDEFAQHMQQVTTRDEKSALTDYRGNKRTLPCVALKEIDEILTCEPLPDSERKLMVDLQAYLQRM